MRRTLIAILCITFLAGWTLCVCAGPIQSELVSYRCIVPDWSKTSGGTSPALSPDGDTLAYLANGRVWIVSGLNSYDPASEDTSKSVTTPEAWQLSVKVPETAFAPAFKQLDDRDDARYVGWSPKGDRLAFIFDGRLFVASALNTKARTADIRMLADMTKASDEYVKNKHRSTPDLDISLNQEGFGLSSIRWSPDGGRIAFLRPIDDTRITMKLCVVDVSSGKEEVVSTDAPQEPGVWGQPWSPDGLSLVYATMKTRDGSNSGVHEGIAVTRLGGETVRMLNDRGMTFSPSWSPKGDQIAYTSPYVTAGIGGMLWGVHVTDVSGKNPKPIAEPKPSKEQLSQALTEMRGRLSEVLKQYPGIYTPAQLKRFMDRDVTDNEVIGILMVAEMCTYARKVGGDLQRKMDQAMAASAKATSGKLLQSIPCVEASDTIKDLPEEQNMRIQKRLGQLVQMVTHPLLMLKSKVDSCPNWSPDGKQIAFVRWDPMVGWQQVLVTDMASGKTRSVFEENTISGLSWSGDGKSLVVQASRNLAYTDSRLVNNLPENLTDIWSQFITMPSYPEIWVLDLK